ncbi:phage tail protein, partial [Xanthomonas arboricola]|uniref:phage tail protein n=1 Tax=Xanthomonas arboricola TaxID=56448 RepID=UPI0021556225
MTEPYIGEIQLFGFDYNPYGWAFCNGATLPIAQNTTLYSLLGVAYGGNGSSTFQLPNFTTRAGCESTLTPCWCIGIWVLSRLSDAEPKLLPSECGVRPGP